VNHAYRYHWANLDRVETQIGRDFGSERHRLPPDDDGATFAFRQFDRPCSVHRFVLSVTKGVWRSGFMLICPGAFVVV
jgi:hypothetical protein